jgi:hypothetical protein
MCRSCAPYNYCNQTWIAQGLLLQPDLSENPRMDANCRHAKQLSVRQEKGKDKAVPVLN